MHGINTDKGVIVSNLLLAETSDILNWVISRVLGEAHRDFLKSISESADGILLNTLNLISLVSDSDRASELSSTTSTDNVGVLDHVTDDTDGIMEATSGFITDSLRSSSNHDSNGLRFFTFLYEDNLVSHGSEGDLRDSSSLTKLCRSNFLKTGNNSSSSSDSQELDFDTTDPSNGGEVVLHEEMVSFIIETPLAEDNVGTGVLDALDHVGEVVSLHLSKFFIIFGALDFKSVLGLRLWGLEGAGKDDTLGISDLLGHLGVREFFVDDNTFNERRVLDSTTGLGDDLDQFKVNIFTIKIGNMEDRLESEISEVILALRDNL